MEKNITYKGYATEPSDYECPDGQLATSLNLINEDNQLKPVFKPQTLASMPQDTKLAAIHQVGTQHNYIVIETEQNGMHIKWFNKEIIQQAQQLPVQEETILSEMNSINGTFSSIQSVTPFGNTLAVLAQDGISYLLWDGCQYINLGRKMPEIQLAFSLTYTLHSADPFKLENNWDDYNDNEHQQNFSEEDKTIYNNRIHATINKLTEKYVTQTGRFNMPFFVRYAYRLYDGKLTMHSAPILMMPRGMTAYMEPTGEHLIHISTAASTLQYYALTTHVDENINAWKDIITSIDIFISAPLYTYNQAKQLDKVFGGYYSLPYVTKGPLDDSYAVVPRSTTNGNSVALPQFTIQEWEEKTKQCAQFYLLKSISIDELQVNQRTDIVPPEGYLHSLLNHETMTDDYFYHNIIAAKTAYNYNARLNIAAIKRKTYDGYMPLSCFTYSEKVIEGTIQPSTTNIIRVEIVRDGKTHVVQRQTTHGSHINFQWPLDKDGVTWFFYPDTKATRAWLFINTDNDSQVYEMILKPHPTLNGACFFNINGPRLMTQQEVAEIPQTTTDNFLELKNKIYTSEVENPFHFPPNGITTVSNGIIIGMAAAAKAMSQGQLGQFPLYAFTTEGVWALEVSSTGSYSARQPITRDVCINTDSITQIDSSVLFATDRGIMLISGSQTQCITDNIFSEAPFNVLDLPGIDQLHAKLGHSADACLPMQPFLGFLAGCQMVYDYVHQRIFVYNPTKVNGSPKYTYAYVFSLKSKMWGMVFTNLASTINAYPEAQAMTYDNKLVSFSETDEQVCKGLYITRPLKLEAADVQKTISTLIQRGHFQRGDVGTVLYGSRDLYKWHLIWSSKDHYLRGFRGTPYKYFRIAGLATLTDGKSIFGASVNFEPRHTNQLR